MVLPDIIITHNEFWCCGELGSYSSTERLFLYEVVFFNIEALPANCLSACPVLGIDSTPN